jgi:hypothetical protein
MKKENTAYRQSSLRYVMIPSSLRNRMHEGKKKHTGRGR